mmetsp:Transcript_43134/g.112256  ORF Transcript_43134/g.112256 Transcript_43134/m.112256 type:complete len:231 (-) Transcript_43134:95-787(-)
MSSPQPSDPNDPCDASYLSISEVNISRPQSALDTIKVDSINECVGAGAPVAGPERCSPPGAGVGLAGAVLTGAGACWDEFPASARRSVDKPGAAPWWAPWKGRCKDKPSQPSQALAQDPVEALGPSECCVENVHSVASELSALTPIALRTPGQSLFGARADDCQTPPGAVATPMELEKAATRNSAGRGSPSAKGNSGGWDLHVQVDDVPDHAPVTADVETVAIFEAPDTP